MAVHIASFPQNAFHVGRFAVDRQIESFRLPRFIDFHFGDSVYEGVIIDKQQSAKGA